MKSWIMQQNGEDREHNLIRVVKWCETEDTMTVWWVPADAEIIDPVEAVARQAIVCRSVEDAARNAALLDAGEDVDAWEDGNGAPVCLDCIQTVRLQIRIGDWEGVLDCPDVLGGVWDCLAAFDAIHGSNIYSKINQDEMRGVAEGVGSNTAAFDQSSERAIRELEEWLDDMHADQEVD